MLTREQELSELLDRGKEQQQVNAPIIMQHKTNFSLVMVRHNEQTGVCEAGKMEHICNVPDQVTFKPITLNVLNNLLSACHMIVQQKGITRNDPDREFNFMASCNGRGGWKMEGD